MTKYTFLLGIFYFLFQIKSTFYSQNFTSSNIPIVVINTCGQDINALYDVIVKMGIIYNVSNKRNYLNDPYNNYNGEVKIKLRGSSSLLFPKKSYEITTLNEVHQEMNISLLGLPPENDWIFKGIYPDKTLLRDELTFRIYNQMGHYSSRTKFFELVLDGNYMGVYCLLEKIKWDKYRVNISKLKENDVTGDELTGGYIISLDKYQMGEAGWYSNYFSNATHDSSNFYLYKYPKPDKILEVQKEYIKNFFDKFEDVFVSPYFNDPDSGYAKYLNVPSFIDNFIINEISKNVDGYRSSTFFHKNRDSYDGKLHAGPIWDYDLGWYNCSYNGGNNFTGWQYQQFAYNNFVPFWWWQILSDNSFVNQLKCRYQYLRSTILDQFNLYQHIDSMALYLDESQARNFEKWPILGQVVYFNPTPVPTTYAGEISNLKSWIQNRLEWLDENMPGICDVGIEDDSPRNSVYCFPNPFTNSLNINYKISESAEIKIELLCVLRGETKLIFSEEKAIGIYQQKIDASKLAEGIYIVKMSINNQLVFNKKLIKVG